MNKNSFIYQAHSEKGVPSSKRLWGGIGYGTFQICVVAATILSLIITKELSSYVKDLLEVDLITSAALLGLSSITGAFGNGRQVNVKDSEEQIEN